MLEIRNVTKIYRSKTGEEVRALDGVSMTFPESGMIFILGKSGSGKSTLLNVMGGLDSYDDGEFIIKGKSSKDFVGSDFDAYRNTFIGFIFQEYNVLDDFTVGANIGLALELQGKKATDEAINGILAQVDLLNYAKRKPNELSGGQKQRVAIARALVKEPQIIMADEPTGALDSNTGKQIFDTLKELSKEKLVLIVSHDRDFAERYADRIIEMADGKVIEDVTKHEHQAERVSEGVHRISDNILRIEKGYRLTAKDLDMINEYLANNEHDVMLSGDGRVNEELRSAAGISKDGATTVFEGTDPARDVKAKKYEKDETRFIRSRLPMKNAVKMGASGLKHKKFRLFMTILLSFLSFAMFGLSSSMAAYEKISAATNSIIDSNIKSAAVSLQVRFSHYRVGDDDINYGYQFAGLNEEDIAFLEENTDLDFVPVFTGSTGGSYSENGFDISHLISGYSSNDVYNATMAGMTTITQDQLNTTGYQLTGALPTKEGEIVITEFLYRQFNHYGFTNEDHGEAVAKGQLTMDANETTGIIGKHITLNKIGWTSLSGAERPSYEIVGVIDTKFDYTRYEKLMPKDENLPDIEEESGLVDMFLQQEVLYERDYGFHALGFVVNEDIQSLTAYMITNMGYKELGTHMDAGSKGLRLIVLRAAEIEGDQPESLTSFTRVATLDELKSMPITWFEEGKSTLAANEILISEARFNDLMPGQAEMQFDPAAFNAMGVAVYGNDVWNHASILARTGRNYRDHLRYAEVVAYIKATIPNMSNQDMQENFSTTDRAAAEAAWINDWIAGSYGIVAMGEENLDYYSINFESRFCARVGVQQYVLGLYGLPVPKHVDTDCIQSALSFLYSFGPGTSHENSYHFDRWSFHWISRLYSYSDAIENEVWSNASLEAQLLKDEYNGLKNSDWQELTSDEKKQYLINYYCDYNSKLKERIHTYTDAELEMMRSDAYKKICGITIDSILSDGVYFELREVDYSQGGEEGDALETPAYKVVGVFEAPSNNVGDFHSVVVSTELYNYYTTWSEEQMDKSEGMEVWKQERADHDDGIWAFAIAAVNADDQAAIRKLVELSYAETDTDKPELLFEMQNAVMYTLGSFNSIIEVLAKVFVWVGLALAVFSSFLLMNFIATSISYKKREIGILRAVGARSSDVFKIFFSESFIIAIINFVLAVVTSLTAVLVLNWYMRGQGINITLLSFGVGQVLLMLGVSVLVAVISSFLPVWKIARKKPVDAIKDR